MILPDPLVPPAALLPMSDTRNGGQRPLHHAPGTQRPYSASLAVVPLQCGKHDTTATKWDKTEKTAVRCGLRTPLTLISNDPAAAVAFAEQVEGPVICKTLSSIVLTDHGQHKITYTTLVNPATIDRIAFAATAHLLQEWVPKAREARVTVVGEQILAVAIEADSPRAHIDWRADYDSLRYLPVDVPADTATGMLAYLDAFGQPPSHRPGDGRDTWFLFTTDNSWAEITTGSTTHTVTEGGPRRIWPAVERAVTEWHRLGRPERGRYGLTANPNGTHHYWLDHPDQHVFKDETTRSNK